VKKKKKNEFGRRYRGVTSSSLNGHWTTHHQGGFATHPNPTTWHAHHKKERRHGGGGGKRVGANSKKTARLWMTSRVNTGEIVPTGNKSSFSQVQKNGKLESTASGLRKQQRKRNWRVEDKS